MTAIYPNVLRESSVFSDAEYRRLGCASTSNLLALTERETSTLLEFRIPGGSLVLRPPDPAPSWLESIGKAFAELLCLEPNWDSYGAKSIRRCHVESALRLLLEVSGADTPKPAVGPTVGGGVVIEWHTNGVDLEIETLLGHGFLVSFEDPDLGIEWDREMAGDVADLVKCVRRLSEHGDRAAG